MRLFISYARIDKPLCAQVAEMLNVHEVWYDQRLYAGRNWWEEILRRLEWCDGFIYLLSPESVSSEYCIKEYEIVEKLDKFIMPVLLDANVELPDSIKELQFIDLSKGFTNGAIIQLLNSLYLTEQELAKRSPSPTPPPITPEDISSPQTSSAVTTIGKAADAMEEGKYDQAVFLLESAKQKGYNSAYVDMDVLLREAKQALEQQSQQRAIEYEYLTIAELVRRRRTRHIGCQAFQSFQISNPGYDPDQIGMICSNRTQLSSRVSVPTPAPALQSPPNQSLGEGGGGGNGTDIAHTVPAHQSARQHTTSKLVPLEWCTVPAGTLRLKLSAESDATKLVGDVPRFEVARYPITNAQYDLFLNDGRGYSNPRWWEFSSDASEWFQRNPTPHSPRYSGSDRPRENVSWYEAMAFCNWLSERLGQNISLPTQSQWRRAAQGDTPRLYPWGDVFDSAYCNTRESRIRMTTLVMRYVNGVSPFGAYDMAGNVWEWCLDAAPGTGVTTTSQKAPRAVQGGSFMTNSERAQIPFHFMLDPEYYYGTIGFRIVRLPG